MASLEGGDSCTSVSRVKLFALFHTVLFDLPAKTSVLPTALLTLF